MKRILTMGLALSMAAAAGAASTISVSIDNNSTPIGMDAADMAGAPGVRTNNWNNWAKDVSTIGDNEDIINSSGVIVPGITMSISATGSWASRDNNHDNDQEMFSDVIDVFGSGRTFSISGVPYASYNVYAYMRDDGATRAGVFSIGTVTNFARGSAGIPDASGNGYVLSTDTTEGSGTDIDPGNYVVFSNLTSSSFDLYVNAVYAGDGTMRNKFAGFQIVNTGPENELFVDVWPAHGSTGITNEPTIMVTVTNGSRAVDTNAFTMDLIGAGVTNDVTGDLVIATPGSGVTTFSYTPPAPLNYGSDYTVAYDVAGIGGLTNSYIATFTTAVDVYFDVSPGDGAENVPTNSLIVVTATNGIVDLANQYNGLVMTINSTDVSDHVDLAILAPGVWQFSYNPANFPGGLDFDTTYDVELQVFRLDGYTNTVQFSFVSAHDPAVYLIAPGIRNGSFEYINGVATNVPQKVTNFDIIDNWTKLSGGATKAGSWHDSAISESAPDGQRFLNTDRQFAAYNLTDHVIQEGDVFEFKWVQFNRPAGVIVGLCYTNSALGGVTNIAASEVTVPDSSSIYHEWSGTYVFGPGDPAIGGTLGLMIQENPMTPGETTTTESRLDKVRLMFGNIALQSISPADGATGVSNTAPIMVTIAESAGQVDTNSIVLTLDGVDITADSVVTDTANGLSITYTPAAMNPVWHTVTVSASGIPDGTISKSWNFLVEPAGGYLIGAGVRNGDFELPGTTSKIVGWDTSNDVPDWIEWDGFAAGPSSNTNGGIENISGDDFGYLWTSNAVFNIVSNHLAAAGEVYSLRYFNRRSFATAYLVYNDGGAVMAVPGAVYTPGAKGTIVGTDFVIPSGSPAIGKAIGVAFMELSDADGGLAHIDDVTLYNGLIGIASVSPEDGATGVASQPTLEVVIAEGDDQVDTGSITLSVDGGSVTPVVNDSATNVVITYTPPSGLSATNHTVSVSADGLLGETVSRTWSFSVAGGGTPTAPVIGPIVIGGGTVGLSWDSEIGVDYFIVSTTNLVTGPWVTNMIISGDGSAISTNVAGGAQNEEFFRLEVQ